MMHSPIEVTSYDDDDDDDDDGDTSSRHQPKPTQDACTIGLQGLARMLAGVQGRERRSAFENLEMHIVAAWAHSPCTIGPAGLARMLAGVPGSEWTSALALRKLLQIHTF